MQVASTSRAEALHIYTMCCPASFFETYEVSAGQSLCVFRQASCRYLWFDGYVESTWPSAWHNSRVVVPPLFSSSARLAAYAYLDAVAQKRMVYMC